MIEAIILWAVTVGMIVYGLAAIADAWRNRPIVLWDDRENRWRAANRLGK